MSKLDQAHPGFASSLHHLLDTAEAGKLVLAKDEKDDKPVVVDRPTLEVALWMAFSLSSAAQAALPELVKAAEKGEHKWIAAIYSAALTLLEPGSATPPPTEVSLVTTFHRCNVWFPKSKRDKTEPERMAQFFRYESFVGYWNKLCKDYDALGEYPFRASPTTTSVPVLTWVGDQDTFDPTTTRARWSTLSSSSTFQVMEGWSHDFGPTSKVGFARVADLVKGFLP